MWKFVDDIELLPSNFQHAGEGEKLSEYYVGKTDLEINSKKVMMSNI